LFIKSQYKNHVLHRLRVSWHLLVVCCSTENFDGRQTVSHIGRATNKQSSAAAAPSAFFAFVVVADLARSGDGTDSEVMEPNEPENGKRFFPSGAIFFFALLILFYAALWLVIYWIMIARA
jgi:hypothetical protein